jgi:NhaP-type Na+/H+ or K+/H+ antiporter
MVVELYDVGLVTIGLVLLGIAVLPLVASERPISMPIVFVLFGMVVFAAPVGFAPPDPLEQGHTAERLAELGVIIALMAVGLKIDRPLGFKAWSSTWRLLAITMPLSIAAAAFLGWWLVGFLAPTAILLGAVIAPTDPVLASEVQVKEPGESEEEAGGPDEAEREDEVRFALTSEAGLNDGLAFPFTNLAIAIALVGIAPGNWVGEWLLIDVGYKILVGVLVGWAAGWVIARIVFATMPETQIAQSVQGIEAIAGTLITYGLTELAGGYGFIAVFVTAVMIRDYERSHDYNEPLHETSELAEQILMALIMVFFGGAIVGGLLAPLTFEAALAALAIVFLVRPVAGMVGLLGFDRPWSERATVSFFGIRGIGTFYYLAHGLNEAAFADADLLWALAGLIVLVSIVVHGITATPVDRSNHRLNVEYDVRLPALVSLLDSHLGVSDGFDLVSREPVERDSPKTCGQSPFLGADPNFVVDGQHRTNVALVDEFIKVVKKESLAALGRDGKRKMIA